MTKKTIFCDFDCVLADLMTPVIGKINEQYELNIDLSHIEYYSWLQENISLSVANIWNKDSIYDEVEPFDGAIEFIAEMRSEFDLKIISSCVPILCETKRRYIKKHFDIDERQIIFTDRKYEYTWNGILVDDYIKHLQLHTTINKKDGILFNYNNRHPWAKKSKHVKNDRIIECSCYSSLKRILRMNYL